jgi:hypothetical protein
MSQDKYTKRYPVPPPTRFGPDAVQRKAAGSAGGRGTPPPPPTRFGGDQAQAKVLPVGAPVQRHVPPPTRFAVSGLQPKAPSVRPVVHAPPPTVYGTSRVQAKPDTRQVPGCRCGAGVPTGVIQRAKAIEFFNKEVESKIKGRNDKGISLGMEVERRPRKYDKEREEQILRYVSTYFLYLANAISQTQDAEVEAMLLQDRILLSANNPKTMGSVYRWIINQNDQLVDVMIRTLDTGSDKRGERVIDGFQTSLMEPLEDFDPNALKLLKALMLEDVEEAVEKVAIKRKGKLSSGIFTGKDYAEKIILIDGLAQHAEQKLLLALVQANYPKNKKVIIRGKKRPCTGCWLCLSFVREVLGYDISYNRNPGRAWKNSISSLKDFVSLAIGKQYEEKAGKWAEERIKEVRMNTFRTHISVGRDGVRDQGYDTESEEE